MFESPVGWAKARLSNYSHLCASSRAVPTRSALRVGKIAIDAAYACSLAQAILPTLQRERDLISSKPALANDLVA
jgi:hypothetical protein